MVLSVFWCPGVESIPSGSAGVKDDDIILNMHILENCCIISQNLFLKLYMQYNMYVKSSDDSTLVINQIFSLQSSLNFEKHSENLLWTENRYEANRRRHNSSDGFDPNIGRPNGGII